MQKKLIGNTSVDCETTAQLMIIYSAFVKHCRKIWNSLKHSISSL